MQGLHAISEFVTERQIRERALSEFHTRATQHEKAAKDAAERGQPFEKNPSMDPALIETPQYQKWLNDRVEDARKSGRLVTERQLEDLRKERYLRVGDSCRYIGPTRLEPTSSGRNYARKTGEIGKITRAVRGNDGLYVYTFLPDFDKAALDPSSGVDVFVAELEVKQGTKGYFTLERIDPKDRSDP